MPWFVRGERRNTKLSTGIRAETLTEARKIEANLKVHGWHDTKVVDEAGRSADAPNV